HNRDQVWKPAQHLAEVFHRKGKYPPGRVSYFQKDPDLWADLLADHGICRFGFDLDDRYGQSPVSANGLEELPSIGHAVQVSRLSPAQRPVEPFPDLADAGTRLDLLDAFSVEHVGLLQSRAENYRSAECNCGQRSGNGLLSTHVARAEDGTVADLPAHDALGRHRGF